MVHDTRERCPDSLEAYEDFFSLDGVAVVVVGSSLDEKAAAFDESLNGVLLGNENGNIAQVFSADMGSNEKESSLPLDMNGNRECRHPFCHLLYVIY